MQNQYKKYENTELWKTLNKLINDLVENQDITENTDRYYIVGYLTKNLAKKIN